MVNTLLLDEKIKTSGLKSGFIVDKLGISRNSFGKKKKNVHPFKKAEIYVLCDLLKITDDAEKTSIFFAEQVH